MTTRTQLTYAAAGIVLVLGLLSLLNPWLAAGMLGFELVAPRAVSEVRATYGALFVTMGALLLWALPQRPRAALVLRAMGLLWAGVALGRIASMTIDGLFTVGNVAGLAVALVLAALLLWGGFEVPPTGAEVRARREVAAARRRADEARRTGASQRGAADRAPAAAPTVPAASDDGRAERS
ncbi:MAG: DUF4345 domain-containing protein [Trueperaceae bacterium]|nr:DUF4345 domain-containing protein [Trueperaceae bacterium]